MLDQNTDRMWYVIGAVIIGAAIILILNNTFPQLFASVGETFKEKTDVVTEVVDGIMPKYGENMLSEYVLYDHNDAGASDISRYNKEGIITINSSSEWGGVYVKLDDLKLKEDTTYLMRYSFQKLGGTLVNIGGHTDYAFDNNHYSVDGVALENQYDYINKLGESLMADDTTVHAVEVYFTTPPNFDPENDLYDGRISIQPNRGNAISINVIVTDLELVEVLIED